MRIDEVETQQDFNELMQIYETSNAPIEAREQAIARLKARFPQFDTSNRLPTKEVLQMIKDGQSDISDMGGYN